MNGYSATVRTFSDARLTREIATCKARWWDYAAGDRFYWYMALLEEHEDRHGREVRPEQGPSLRLRIET